jgi:DNA-binding transcriptional LysR family regulator
MPTRKERHALRSERNGVGHAASLDWESARVFLEIARSKSFRGASGTLQQSVNALRRRLDQFEAQLGAALFTRHVDGVRLTEEGQRVLAAAQRMETDAFDLVRAAAQADAAMDGEVRLAVTEGLGTFWLAPHLAEFRRANPRVLVDLRCAMTPADILRLEADVSVQLARPTQKDLRSVKLGRMHLMPYAARSYIERHGLPRSRADLANHFFAAQVADHLVSAEGYASELGDVSRRVATRTNVSGAHYFAVATGAAIGLLPTYSTAVGATVMPLDIEFRAHHDIWLVYHPDAGRIPRVRQMIDWLIAAFSPQRFPWFADEFVHPDRFPKFAGMMTREALAPFLPQ